jgi:transposase
VTERWSAYSWYPTWRRQLGWAQLWRASEAMITRGGRSAEGGEALRVEARQRFHWWHRVRDRTLPQASFRTYMQPVRREVERLLEGGQRGGVPTTEGTCREIFKLRQALGTFVRHEGVEPTNTAAERAIRPGVLWRTGSFGTQSVAGARFGAAMMTVVATLKQQPRTVLDSLPTTCQAALGGESAPSLLPTPADSQQLMRPAA